MKKTDKDLFAWDDRAYTINKAIQRIKEQEYYMKGVITMPFRTFIAYTGGYKGVPEFYVVIAKDKEQAKELAERYWTGSYCHREELLIVEAPQYPHVMETAFTSGCMMGLEAYHRNISPSFLKDEQGSLL